MDIILRLLLIELPIIKCYKVKNNKKINDNELANGVFISHILMMN